MSEPPADAERRLPQRWVGDYGRHAGDAVRLALGLALLTVTAVPVTRQHLPVLEKDAFRFFNDLPSALFPIVWLVMQLGNFVAVPVAAALALGFRRPRMALDLSLSGALAFALAKVVKSVVKRGRPASFLGDVHIRGGAATGLGYLSGHAAVAAALATAAAPWLGRRSRRLVWALVLVVLLARVYTGAHLPLDVIGGAALGWAVGATVHLLIGAPTARLSPRATRTVLEGMGFALDEGVTVQDSGRHALVRTAAGQPLFVTVLVREHRDTDLVHRGWRRLGSRWVREHGRFVPPLARVHHHAALALLARNAGVRAPEVVAVGTFGNGSAVLVERHVEGRRLRQLQSEEVLAVLPGVWEQVAALRRAHISHGDLGAANVLVDGTGQAWLLDFTAATSGASDTRLTDDVADLLAALTELVGADSAVRSAVDGIGSSGLAALTDRLRHPYRSGQSREVRAARRNLLSALGALNTPRGSS